jgi:hypothetical protein
MTDLASVLVSLAPVVPVEILVRRLAVWALHMTRDLSTTSTLNRTDLLSCSEVIVVDPLVVARVIDFFNKWRLIDLELLVPKAQWTFRFSVLVIDRKVENHENLND